jgi:hypothetical protein
MCKRAAKKKTPEVPSGSLVLQKLSMERERIALTS